MDFVSKTLFSLKKFLASASSHSVLGLDIGTSSIKVAQLKREKEWAVLETYGEISLSPYGGVEIGRAVKLTNEKLTEAIKDIIKEANVKAKRAAVSIPLKSSFVTVIQIPDLEEKEISEMIKMEARKYIPVPISEVIIDWWIFPEDDFAAEDSTPEAESDSDGQEKKTRKFIKVLLVAIHKNIISEYKKIISSCGLELSKFEIESFGMIRSILARETSPVAIVDFGASSVKIAIVDFGIMKSAYTISQGSQDITLALSKSLGVDFKKAEEIKREVGLSKMPEHREIVGVMTPLLDYVFSEIKSVITDYQRKNKQVVTRAILTGGGAMMKGIADLAIKNLNMETSLAEPFSKTEYPAFLEGALKEAGLSFSVAAGLALGDLQ